jgi:hypothetical protein
MFWGLLFSIPVFGMAKYGGTVLKTSLSKDGEKELHDALYLGDATAPSARHGDRPRSRQTRLAHGAMVPGVAWENRA